MMMQTQSHTRARGYRLILLDLCQDYRGYHHHNADPGVICRGAEVLAHCERAEYVEANDLGFCIRTFSR